MKESEVSGRDERPRILSWRGTREQLTYRRETGAQLSGGKQPVS